MRGADSYTRRFRYWQFWGLILAVVVDLLVFALPVFALAVLLVLFQPDGWRWLERLTTVVRQMQEG